MKTTLEQFKGNFILPIEFFEEKYFVDEFFETIKKMPMPAILLSGTFHCIIASDYWTSLFQINDQDDAYFFLPNTLQKFLERNLKKEEEIFEEPVFLETKQEVINIRWFIKSFYNFKKEKMVFVIAKKLQNYDQQQFIQKDSNSLYVHDLRAPLRTINNFAELIIKQNHFDEMTKEKFSFLIDRIHYMQLFIDDILNNPSCETSSTIEIVEEVKKSLKSDIDENDVTIKYSHLPDVDIPSTKVAKLFQNFFENSIKFRLKNIPLLVEITVSDEFSFWHFVIKDNGMGIKNEMSEKVFDLYYSKDNKQGYGVGMTLCKQIVEYYKGNIWIENVNPFGCAVHFTLPKKKIGSNKFVIN
ncbi:MAG: sensor histidine kinase [Alphaproteobacteria bacterium]